MCLRLLTVLLIFYQINWSFQCSFFAMFPLAALNPKPLEYEWWNLPPVFLPEAEEEAIMLIGGKHCMRRRCSYKYTRTVKSASKHYYQDKVKSFDTNDPTVKFFTKYGFCRRPGLSLPTLPEAVSGLGAVTLPDGRVIMCGGVVVELRAGAKLEARNSTDCWVWIWGGTTIKPLEWYSKLPFRWLGPLTPKQMQLVKFDYGRPLGGNDKESTAKPEAAGLNQKMYDWEKVEYDPDYLDGQDIPVQAKAPEREKDYLERLFSLETVNDLYFPDTKNVKNYMEFYRIIILPWPPYTEAYKRQGNDKFVAGGDVISGYQTIDIDGPRLKWERIPMQTVGLGYGGCWTVEKVRLTGNPRIWMFGGRELNVDHLNRDFGWSQKAGDVNRWARHIDLDMPRYINFENYSHDTNKSGKVFLRNDGRPIRAFYCEDIVDDQREKVKMGIKVDKPYVIKSRGDSGDPECYLKQNEYNGDPYLPLSENVKKILQEDRLFFTCHTLPKDHFSTKDDGSERADIILIGGGADTMFFDRQRILSQYNTLTPVYRSVARYVLQGSQMANFDDSFFFPHDARFGRGLKMARTRHASEIIKTYDVSENKTKYQLWVFGGYSASKNETLDTVEFFDLENPFGEFKMYGNDERSAKEDWRYRLPWPLMDIATVKIPIDWLPTECKILYQRRCRQIHGNVPWCGLGLWAKPTDR